MCVLWRGEGVVTKKILEKNGIKKKVRINFGGSLLPNSHYTERKTR